MIWKDRLPAFLVAAFGLLLTNAPVTAQQANTVNKGVLELETAGSTGISVRIAEDLANLVDDGATRRVVPIVGKGGLQTLMDLKYLHGVDLAIVPLDVLDYAREQRLFVAPENSFAYITKLYNEGFHLLGRPEIKTIRDLSGKKINIDLGSSTAITSNRIFDSLKLQISAQHDPQLWSPLACLP